MTALTQIVCLRQEGRALFLLENQSQDLLVAVSDSVHDRGVAVLVPETDVTSVLQGHEDGLQVVGDAGVHEEGAARGVLHVGVPGAHLQLLHEGAATLGLSVHVTHPHERRLMVVHCLSPVQVHALVVEKAEDSCDVTSGYG